MVSTHPKQQTRVLLNLLNDSRSHTGRIAFHPRVQPPHFISEQPDRSDRLLRSVQLEHPDAAELLPTTIAPHGLAARQRSRQATQLDRRGVDEDVTHDAFGQGAVDLGRIFLGKWGGELHLVVADG